MAKAAKRKKKAAPPIRRKCGTMQVHHWLLEDDPEFRARQVALEHDTSMRARTALAKKAEPYRIKVVVHVVYANDRENISDAQVKSQIKALNRDYRAKNTDKSKVPTPFAGLVADAFVEFELASVDPKGKPTNGITRTATTRTEFEDDDAVKHSAKGGADAWPTDKYLNLWVCTLGGGLLGYAQFPGGPVKTDGVVILNTAFGTTGSAKAPFNKGRTATHEVGHYLNLRHIWGDTEDCSGGDLVADTPNAETANFGKPKFPHVTCSNGPNGDMFMNYMDYVDDAAMFMFSSGQVQRMHVALDGPRKKLYK
jgi:hypothetical protein